MAGSSFPAQQARRAGNGFHAEPLADLRELGALAPTARARVRVDAFGARVEREGSESDAYLKLPPPNPGTVLQELQAEGAAAERARIQSVLGQQIHAGHADLVQRLAFDGHTTGPEAAVAVLQQERNARNVAAANLASDAPAPP